MSRELYFPSLQLNSLWEEGLVDDDGLFKSLSL